MAALNSGDENEAIGETPNLAIVTPVRGLWRSIRRIGRTTPKPGAARNGLSDSAMLAANCIEELRRDRDQDPATTDALIEFLILLEPGCGMDGENNRPP